MTRKLKQIEQIEKKINVHQLYYGAYGTMVYYVYTCGKWITTYWQSNNIKFSTFPFKHTTVIFVVK
jgi:hypothetical protein